MKQIFLGAAALLLIAGTVHAQTAALDAVKDHPFYNIKVSESGGNLIVTADGVPKHEYGPFPGVGNPNTVRPQNYRFVIPTNPELAPGRTQLPRGGPVGITISGVPIYNQYTAEGHNAVEGPLAEIFDVCLGHPQRRGGYHYHQAPKCLIKDEPGKHSKLLGWAFDGFPLFGPQAEGGKAPRDLDVCNGHKGSDGKYHYHVTRAFPYTIGCYSGEVEMANFRRGPGGKGKFGKGKFGKGKFGKKGKFGRRGFKRKRKRF